MLTALLMSALAASPATEIRLASPGLNLVNVEEKTGDFFGDYFAQQLMAQGGIRVTTKSEISALIGFERQKQLLGCSDASTSCLAELAGALGVDGLVTGSIAQFDKEYTVTLKIVAAVDARPLGTAGGRFGSERAILDWMTATAPRLAAELKRAFRPRQEEAPVAVRDVPVERTTPVTPVAVRDAPVTDKKPPLATPPAPIAAAPLGQRSLFGLPVLRPHWWIPAATGVALAGTGFWALSVGKDREAELRDGAGDIRGFAELNTAVAQAESWQSNGNFLIAGGAVSLLTAGAFFLLGPQAPAIAVVPTKGGAVAAVGGAL